MATPPVFVHTLSTNLSERRLALESSATSSSEASVFSAVPDVPAHDGSRQSQHPPLQVKVLPLQCSDFANAQTQTHRNHDHHLNVVRKLSQKRGILLHRKDILLADALPPRKWPKEIT